eukprot:TRINITY_DN26173_c0_g1_i2.p1 TRINITY_DN26173_c0_g1~~TRINITY_DN26173_c0_g1_i2.p1  ORF type:complete len:681 (-),score=171.11 TRINITY_DN26173_c0_g1_i2:361-2403(-)
MLNPVAPSAQPTSSFQEVLAGWVPSVVASCEALAVERETALRAENEQLRLENAKLRKRIAELGLSAPVPPDSGKAKPVVNVEDDLTAPMIQIEEEKGGFEMLPMLMKDNFAGKKGLHEAYWNTDSRLPEHDHGYLKTGQEIALDVDSDGRKIRKAHGMAIDPSSIGHLIWDVVGIPILAWDLITIPMQVFGIGDAPAMVAMGWVTLIYWTGDMPITFLTGFYDKDGDLVMDLKIIICKYVRGFFMLDVLILFGDWGAIAIEAVGSSAPGAMKNLAILRIFRITRFARLLRMRKLKEIYRNVCDNMESEMTLVVLNMITAIIKILAVNHYICCAWFGLGSLMDYQESWQNAESQGYGSWLSDTPYPQYKSDKGNMAMMDAPWTYQYAVSLHWAVAQFTPGGVHIQPQNIPERVFNIFCLIFGMVVFSSFLANVTQARMQMAKMMSKLEKDLWTLRKFCKANNVSRELTIRIKRYIDMVVVKTFHKLTPADCVLIPQLSKHLREELNTELTTQKLSVHPLFVEVGNKNKAVMHVICNLCIDKLVLAKGDVLFASGTIQKCVLFNLGGDWEYIPQFHHHEIEMVQKGGWCAEAVLWTVWTTQGQLQADVESQALMLQADKVRNAFVENGIIMPFVRRYAQSFLTQMNAELEIKGMPNDMQMNFTLGVDIAQCRLHSQQNGGRY